MLNSLENDYASYRLRNGILYFEYKENVIVNLEEAIKIVDDRLKLQAGKSYPILCNTRGIKSMDKDARWYLATEGSQLAIAVALIRNTPLSRLLAEMYMLGSVPSVPTKIVDNEGEGLEFLNKYSSS
ncbi:DUF7793 family protein [Gelidibacter salicanalis]|uniref:DUF7793 domain-containing protein n=1 Tax=Gelidibacter salicanalis TaxID=291193 RepID=A0A934KNF8_9FLAO|nr:hypothetical protein [Gelidibacter salicanalis]MBJ7880509.1 hypothetical protein [Gelidibacter salicanalis]